MPENNQMTLNDLKARITTNETDEKLQVLLDDAIDFACGFLHVYFEDEEMPARVKKIIAKHVASELAFNGAEGVKSESIGGMSQTFESKEERDRALQKELLATRLRKVRWS